MRDTDHIVAELQGLPPELPEPGDRFEQIAVRVRRRRRQQTTVAAVAGVAVLALAVPVANQLLPETAVGPAGGVTGGVTASVDPTSVEAAPSPLPGGDRVTHLSEPLTATHTGTATVQLGERPDGANGVAVWLDCLSAGEFIYPGGGSMICEGPEEDLLPPEDFAGAAQVIGLAGSRDTIEIEASEGASWQIRTSYVNSTGTEWGVNARGQTFGVQNENGEPDLIAVTATNGRAGYASVAEMNVAYGPEPTSPEHAYRMQEERAGQTVSVPVYESDGETVIGEFVIGGGVDSSRTDTATATATATQGP